MVLKISLFIAMALMVVACGETTASKPERVRLEDETPPDGDLLFLNNCASCHGVDGKLGVSDAEDLSKTSLTADEIREVIIEGRNGMPPFEHLIKTEEEREALVDKVLSLKE